jgi:hypothetical protein
VTTSNAKDPTFVSDYCSAEFWNIETIIEGYFVGVLSIDIPKMNRFRAPFEVVNILVTAVTLLQNECVLEQLTKFFNNVNLTVVCNSAV